MAPTAHDSDSKTQREVETQLISCLGRLLNVELSTRVVSVDGCKIQLDGYFEDATRIVVAEAFARIGKPASGQRRKVLTDVLKLAFFDSAVRSASEKKIEKYLAFADSAASAFLEGKSWAARVCDSFGMQIRVIDLCADVVKQVRGAQERQKKGMSGR